MADNDNDSEEDRIVLLEVRSGDAALVFTSEGLQAYLPEEMAAVALEDLPWHLQVVEHAMDQIQDYATARVEVDAERHALDCTACRDAALMALVKRQLPGEA